jgi:hypothetical protein
MVHNVASGRGLKTHGIIGSSSTLVFPIKILCAVFVTVLSVKYPAHLVLLSTMKATPSYFNLSKNQLDAQYLCFVIRLLRLLHPSTCFEQ